MVIVLILATLALLGVIAAVVATLRDARGPAPHFENYDSRRPVL